MLASVLLETVVVTGELLDTVVVTGELLDTVVVTGELLDTGVVTIHRLPNALQACLNVSSAKYNACKDICYAWIITLSYSFIFALFVVYLLDIKDTCDICLNMLLACIN